MTSPWSPARRLLADGLQWAWSKAMFVGAITSGTRAARRFGRFGDDSFIAFPTTAVYNERYIWIGSGTRIGPHVSLSVGMAPGQVPVTDPVVRIGDRCLIGRGSGIVGHLSIEIGDDVFTGHHVYITDQNHGYEDVSMPIGLQTMPERPVRVGSGSWLGHGSIVLPGVTIGRHVVVAAGTVVTEDVPDFSVVAGIPGRVIRRYVEGSGWVPVPVSSSLAPTALVPPTVVPTPVVDEPFPGSPGAVPRLRRAAPGGP